MNVEDELRETMRAHDAEAPSAAALADRPWRRRRSTPGWLAAAAAAVVVVGVAGGVLVARSSSPSHPHTTRAGAVGLPPSCPARYELGGHPWVPPAPYRLRSPDRLVPTTAAKAGRICAYIGPKGAALNPRRWPKSVALTGSRELTTTALAKLTGQLSWLPRDNGQLRPCTADLAPSDDDGYLVGLRYPTGVLWVSILGNHCAGAGNGAFEISTNLVKEAQSAYRTGAWPTPTATTFCSEGGGSRLGQERRMVPDVPIRAVACYLGSHHVTRVVSDPHALAQALNSVSASAWDGTCKPAKSGTGAQYVLTFEYRAGPPVDVTVTTGCNPAVWNGTLKSALPAAVLEMLRHALGER